MSLDVPELLKVILDAEASIAAAAPGGVVVGPASNEEQKAICISILEAGAGEMEPYAPVVHQRFVLRAISPFQITAHKAIQAVFDVLNPPQSGKKRRVVTQGSTGETFLVHETLVNTLPSAAKGEAFDYWEDVMVAEVTVGTEPIT